MAEPAAAAAAVERAFWLRADGGGEQMSDSFRVKLRASAGDGSWRAALVQDLKEQLLEQCPSLFASPAALPPAPTPLPWLFLWLPPQPQDTPTSVSLAANDEHRSSKSSASNAAWIQLQASSSLGALPDGAGTPSWPLIARLSPPTPPRQVPAGGKRLPPTTLFEKGIAGPEEPEQIKNAKELSDLYPGGVLPRSGPNDFNVAVLLKLILTFALLGVIAAGAMYLLGEVVPQLLQEPGAHTSSPPPPQHNAPSVFKVGAGLAGSGQRDLDVPGTKARDSAMGKQGNEGVTGNNVKTGASHREPSEHIEL